MTKCREGLQEWHVNKIRVRIHKLHISNRFRVTTRQDRLKWEFKTEIKSQIRTISPSYTEETTDWLKELSMAKCNFINPSF